MYALPSWLAPNQPLETELALHALTPQPRSLLSFLLSSNQAQQVSACLDAMGDSQPTPTLMVSDKWMKSTSTQKIGTPFFGLALHGRREEILKTTQTKSGNWET